MRKKSEPQQSISIPPGIGRPLSLTRKLARIDPDGVALGFGSPNSEQFSRLKALMDADMERQWQGLLQAMEARAGGRFADSDDELTRWQVLLNRLGFEACGFRATAP